MTYFPEAYERFREAIVEIDPERFPAPYIDRQVLTGGWRCWGSETAVILAELKTYPSGLREVHGVVAAGDAQEIVSLIPLAEEWGRELGCRRAVIESREGWRKMLPDYELHQTSVRKEL